MGASKSNASQNAKGERRLALAFSFMGRFSVRGGGGRLFSAPHDRDRDENHRQDGGQKCDLAQRLEAGGSLDGGERLTRRCGTCAATSRDARVVPAAND